MEFRRRLGLPRTFMAQLRSAVIIVWLIIAAVCGAAVAAPLVMGPATVQSLVPVCEARAKNTSCPACGLTTAFIAIAHGSWGEAQEANRGAIPLFAGFAVNFGAAAAYLIRKLRSGGIKWD
jgi:hypothetical protein